MEWLIIGAIVLYVCIGFILTGYCLEKKWISDPNEMTAVTMVWPIIALVSLGTYLARKNK